MSSILLSGYASPSLGTGKATQRLYKLTSSGKIQTWMGVAIADEHYTITGYIDGKIGAGNPTKVKGKNIGRSNETTGNQQAELEIIAKATKKLERDGYKLSELEARNNKVFMPMLAKKYQDAKHKLVFPVAVQRKYDGVRCTSRVNYETIHAHSAIEISLDIRTRKNVKFPSRQTECVSNMFSLKQMFDYYDFTDCIIDGEFYSETLTFQQVCGAARRETWEVGELSQLDQLCYREYDFFDPRHPELTFKERFNILKGLAGFTTPGKVEIVETYVIQTEDELTPIHDLFIDQGYEGLIIRNLDSVYAVDKRSSDLQKMKAFDDAEFEIIGAKQGSGNDAGCVVWDCRMHDGKTFEVRPRGTVAERQEWFDHAPSYMGELITVRYFGFTDEGKPRNPVGIVIRSDEL